MPESLTRALEASVGVAISEIPGTLSLQGQFSQVALEAWHQATRDAARDGYQITCRDAIGEVQDLDEADLPALATDDLRITLTIENPACAVHLGTAEGLSRVLAAEDTITGVEVLRLLNLDLPVETEGPRIERWEDGARACEPRSPSPYPSPRRFARTIAGTVRAPLEIDPWLLRGDSARNDTPFVIWRQAAAVNIQRALVNEIYEADGATQVVLAGMPTRRIALGAAQVDSEFFRLLQRAARWVFTEGQDVELRHTLLTNELAREWRDDEAFAIGLAKRLSTAMESASLAYRAHVQQSSKETIKSLSDLRKTLAEEIGKVTQQTRDLTASLWRDVAVAIVAIAFRFSLDSAKAGSGKSAFALIFMLVATYIVISQVVSVWSSRAFLGVAAESRAHWRRKGYAYLSDEEFDALAEEPLKNARKIYDRVELTANWVAGIVAAFLLTAAAAESGLFAAIWSFMLHYSC